MQTNTILNNSSEFHLNNEEVFIRGIPAAINVGKLSPDALRLLVYYVSKVGPFQLAVDSGYFDGTLEEWLNSLGGSATGGNTVQESSKVPEQTVEYTLTEEDKEFLRGKSAYELAVSVGFEGTLEEWLESLKATAEVQSVTTATVSPVVSTTNLRTLKTGEYYVDSTNTAKVVALTAEERIALGYPAELSTTGALRISIVLDSYRNYIILTLLKEGTVFTQQGSVNSSEYTPWKSVGGRSRSPYVKAGESLNNIVESGTYTIANAVLTAAKDKDLGFPEKATSGTSALTVYESNGEYVIQEFINAEQLYRRTLVYRTKQVFRDWAPLFPASRMDAAGLASPQDLNTIKTPGIYGIRSPVLLGNLADTAATNYPPFLEASGGGMLIVAKSDSHFYQTIITTTQRRIATRQTLGDGSFTPWVEVTATQGSTKRAISFGSSTFAGLSSLFNSAFAEKGVVFTNASIGGQILETIQAHQGSNPVSIKFEAGVIPVRNEEGIVIVTQKDVLGTLKPKGSFAVTLSNGVKGTLNLDTNKFKTLNTDESYEVGEDELEVDFGYASFAEDAIHLINIGKNNITSSYKQDVVIAETIKMIDFIKAKGNSKFLVMGHFANTDATQGQKDTVLAVNAALKRKYALQYIDVHDYLMSETVWADTGITATPEDLLKQAANELAPSLGKDKGHMNTAANTAVVNRIKTRLIELGYI